jgi:hypothetical protein
VVDSGLDPDPDPDPEPDPDPDCADDTCCIGDRGYASGATNPDNVCEKCDPAASQDDFVLLNAVACGSGCTCDVGRPREASCNDRQDNDRDSQRDCADTDCAGKLCQGYTTVRVAPTRDVEQSGAQDNPTVKEGNATLVVHSAPFGTDSWARLDFSSIPSNAGFKPQSAELQFYDEIGGGPVNAFAADRSELGGDGGDGPGLRSIDLSAVVIAWARGTDAERKYVYLYFGSQGTAAIRASEHADVDTRPALKITYEASCVNRECPAP